MNKLIFSKFSKLKTVQIWKFSVMFMETVNVWRFDKQTINYF